MKYFLAALALVTIASAQQTIPQWSHVHNGEYTAQHVMSVVSIPDGKFGAVISSTLGFDSSNIVQCTDDGGATWRNVRYGKCYNVDPITFKPLEGWWKEQYYQAVARPSRDTIILVVARRPKNDVDDSPIYGTLIPHVERSTDGGTTWNEIPVGATPLPAWYSSCIAMDHHSIGYLYSGDKEDSTVGRLYRTTDAGATWQATAFKDYAFIPHGMRCLGPDTVYMWNSQQLVMSKDGGATFMDIGLPEGATDVQWMTSTVGVVVGGIPTGTGTQRRAFVYTTENAGLKWRPLLDSILDGSEIVSIAVDAKGNILALGRDRVMHRDNVKRRWESAPFPFGTSKYNASAIRWTQSGHAVAVLLDAVLYYTTKRELTTPFLSFKADGEQHRMEWTSETSDVRYHVQVASKTSQDPMGYDFKIFNSSKAILLDTVISTSSTPLLTLPKGHDVYGRVRRFSATDSSGWSDEAILRIPSAPPPPFLDRPTLTSPEDNIVVTSALVVFTWDADARTQTYDLMLTSRGTYDGAFDDSVAQNVHGLKSTVTSNMLTVGKTYWWYVVEFAPGFSPTSSANYRSFRIDATSSVRDVVIDAAETIVAIYDVRGCAIDVPAQVSSLPTGRWFLHLRSGVHDRYVPVVVP